ncbi:LptE family protein [Leeuwenhoekiella sp. A16]|uniref:LptE family protein n=1 Tax=unclassified Leeuwenhoekiella TaxID=2615029 RepID=UPI003A7FC8C2
MQKKFKITGLLLITLVFNSCGFYSFSGVSIEPGTETFQVNFFQNNAALVEPGLDRKFTFALQDLIQNQTSLSLTPNGGDLIYEGEIVDYYIAPQTATSDNIAAQNRLTITVNVRYINTKKEDGTDDFEQRFSFYVDRPGTQQLIGSALDSAVDEIFERITQDIFNESLANW